MLSKLHEAAANYHRRGLKPIPCLVRDKKPKVPWLEYQRKQPLLDEVDRWWTDEPNANIALLMGCGLLAVDLDGEGAEKLLWDVGIVLPDAAPRVETGKGAHVYLSVSEVLPNSARLLQGEGCAVDIRGDGGYVIAPPSIHETGRVYRWSREGEWPPPLAPARLIELIRANTRQPRGDNAEPRPSGAHDWISTALQGVGEGARNDTCARLAGYLLTKLPFDVTLSILTQFGARCRPPMPEREVRITCESIRRRAGEAGEERTEEESDAPLVIHVSAALDAMRAEMAEGERQFVKTPFPGLNHFLVGGFGPGELVYLGSRPGVGKTALALELARGAGRAGKRVLFISREMLASALARRMVAQEGGVSASELKLGRVDAAIVDAVAETLSALPIWISDRAVSLQDLHAAIAAMPEPLDYLIVDYLQLIRTPRGIGERRMQVEHVSQALKDIAMKLSIPVVCLSSLSRPPTGSNARPTLASLRESGELEHDASIVLLLYRPDENGTETECIVAKGREGRLGTVKLNFQGEFVRFAELETRYGSGDYPEHWTGE